MAEKRKLGGRKKGPSPAKRPMKARSEDLGDLDAQAVASVGTSDGATPSEYARARTDYDPKASKEADKFAKDLSSFLERSCGLEIQTLSERDSVPYWINSGSFAINWIIGDSFFDGIPGTKAVLVAGECLGPDTEIEVMVSDNLAKLLK